MITRKNLLALAVSTSLAAGLVACGGEEASEKMEATATEAAKTVEKSADMEGKCGGNMDKMKEGKCGGNMDKDADKMKEGKCGGNMDKDADKMKEGKCGGMK